MQTLVVVGCGKLKRDYACEARDLYTGQLFKLAREYAERFGSAWCILSAKYGAIEPGQVIAPYDKRLSGQRAERVWLRHSFQGLYCRYVERVPGDQPRFVRPRLIVLAGADYAAALAEYSPELPLAGLGIGDRLAWLNRELGRGAAARGRRQAALFT